MDVLKSHCTHAFVCCPQRQVDVLQGELKSVWSELDAERGHVAVCDVVGGACGAWRNASGGIG